MKKINTILVAAFMLVAAVSCKKETKTTDDSTVKTDTIAKVETYKIVSLNGAVTEIVSALGHEKEIVGVDVTSTYPESLKATAKDLGHVRSISIEAIMALKPTLILATDKDMSPELLEKLKILVLKLKYLHRNLRQTVLKKLIADVAKALNNDGAKALQDKIDADLKNVSLLQQHQKYYIYARGANMMMVAGTR